MRKALLPPHLLAMLLVVCGVAIASLFLTWRWTNGELRLDGTPQSAGLEGVVRTGAKLEGGNSGTNQAVTYAGQGKSPSVGSIDSQEPVSNGTPTSSDQTFNSGQTADGAVPTNQESTVIVNMPIPAAYGNPKVLSAFSPADQEEIQEIGSNFTATIESSGVTPDSPEYTQVWKRALRDADDSFRAKFGIEAFEAMQMSQGDQ